MRRRTWSLRRQVVVSTVLLTALAMTVMVLVVAFVLEHVDDRQIARDLSTRAAAVVDSITPGQPLPDTDVGEDGRLGAGALIYDRAGDLQAGRPPQAFARVLTSLSRVTERRTVDLNDSTRLLAVPFAKAGGGVVVVAEPLSPYESSERDVLQVTLILGALVTLGAGLVAFTSVRRALRPVVDMAGRADEWSEHDLARRFELGSGTTELSSLASTLDHLLDRVAAAVRTEQRLTADIAHELRTPLTAILGAADLALLDDLPAAQRESFQEIAAAARRLDETVTTLVEVARTPGGLAGPPGTVGAVADELGSRPHLVLDVPAEQREVAVAAPSRLVARALGPVLDNAVRYATAARVSVQVAEDRVRFVVDDDGPGVSDGEALFTAGRGRAGLGLPLARRVARSAGGDVVAEPSPSGARFVAEFPRG